MNLPPPPGVPGQWNIQGDWNADVPTIRLHLSRDHGFTDTVGYSRDQLLAIHDSLHNNDVPNPDTVHGDASCDTGMTRVAWGGIMAVSLGIFAATLGMKKG